MKLQTCRIIIYPKDIQLITGRSERYARKIMAAIRKRYGKEKHQLISVNEFCDYIGLERQEVEKYLG